MEIIEKGDKKKFWSTVVVCTGKGNSFENSRKRTSPCGAKLKVDLQDIFITSHTYWDGSKDDFFTIKCPCCGCLTDLSKSKVPYSLQDYIYNKRNDNERTF